MQYFIIFILFMLCLPLCAQESISRQERLSKIDSIFNAYYQPDKPGGAMAIIENGQTTYSNHIGLANIEHRVQITDSTAFHIASVSKQFTAFLALLLEQEGKLSLTRDIRDYLPELKNLPNKISVQQLTNHTHGLPNLSELAQLKGVGPQDRMSHKQVVEMLLQIRQVNFAAGNKYEYNNTGYTLLAEIIERTEKKPFEKVLEEKIFKPLEMNHSQAIGNSDIVIPNKAYSYQLTDGNHVKFDLGITTVGSSGVSTTIHDLGLWAKNYQKTVVGTTEIYDRMQKATYLNSGEKLHYGMGLQFGTYKGLDIVFHGGGDVGYRSYILHVPKHQLSIVMLANSNDFSSLDLVYKTVDILFDKELNTQAEEKTIASPGELKKLEGMYEIFPGTYYEILAEKGNLYFQQLGTTDKAPLPQLNENTFDFPYIPHSRLVFYPDKFDFHIADFAYPAYRKRMQIPNPKEMDLKAFAGIYRNKDHDITYELIVRNNLLIAKHKGNGEIILNALTKTSFYSTQSFFGQLDFFATSKGAKGFKLSGQNLKNIVFEKYH